MNISEFLSGIPVNAVLRERIALLLEDKQRLEKQVKELQEANAGLVKDCGTLRSQLAGYQAAAEYVEHRGVLFKRQARGGYALIPYCAACHVPLGSVEGLHMSCAKCRFIASFNFEELNSIHLELARL